MVMLRTNPENHPLSRAMQLRKAVLMVFCNPVRTELGRLLHATPKEWEELLTWLDTSGLALYFLDRVEEAGLLNSLPAPVVTQLRNRLADNTQRLEELMSESTAIQRSFQKAGLSYAVLKGFSLWPTSVPKLVLRSQLDLDFLIADECVDAARRILEDAGYRLNAEDAKNLDFKANEGRTTSLKDLYKAGRVRSAELHKEHVVAGRPSILTRTQTVSFDGIQMPVLAPLDLFLGQGLHLFKHICLSYWRAAHMIEFRRHVIARYDDLAFWNQLEEHVAGHTQTCIRLGVAILVIARVMGPFAPEALTRWTADQVPATAKLWVDLYARRAALAAFPGSKLYLLLEKELQGSGMSPKRSPSLVLAPRRLPPFIVHPVAGETLTARINRYYRQFGFLVFRLRFHILEGIRYFCESILWRQCRNGVSR
jgi:Uncharacterised nucleotidyltransferase